MAYTPEGIWNEWETLARLGGKQLTDENAAQYFGNYINIFLGITDNEGELQILQKICMHLGFLEPAGVNECVVVLKTTFINLWDVIHSVNIQLYPIGPVWEDLDCLWGYTLLNDRVFPTRIARHHLTLCIFLQYL